MSDTVELNHCPKCGASIPAGAPQGLCPKCVLVGAASGADSTLGATATSEIPSLERVAAAFPQLEILELVGRGGMGFVFKARQPHLDRFVALKLLPDKLAQDPRFTERFNREGRMLARLNHPNIVSVYDFGQTEHFYFLLMEFVDGVNLRQAMQAGRFSPGEALAIVPKICEALQYAHGQGILHRDIKPENILLDSHGHVKIADFGIAKLVGEEKSDVSLTQTGAALGSPHYMAPEQLEKPTEVDHRADIYSLGVVFYEMLTGELPIGRFAAPSSKTPVSANVDDVVFRTLEKDREKRYQSAGEVKSQVEHLTQAGAAVSGAVPPKIPGAEAIVPKWSQKAVWAAVLTALSLPLLLPLLIVAYLGAGGLGWLPRILAFGAISLPGVIGCFLGWMALSDIRAHQGRLRGLPLAVFAALAWPLFFLVGVTVLAPWLMIYSPSAGGGRPFIPLLVLMVPVGAITFAIWAVYAAARWGANKPASRRRGVLKWVFLILLIAGFGVLVLPNFVRRAPVQREAPSVHKEEVALAQPVSSGPQPIRANFRAAKGQVVTLEVLRRDNDTAIPVPFFDGYAVASDEERARFSLLLTPTEPFGAQTNRPAWRLSLVTEEGATASGVVVDFGELIPNLPRNHLHSIEPDSSFEIMLTRPYPGAETNGLIPRTQLSLAVVSRARGKIGGPQEATTVGVGSTNWMKSLREIQSSTAAPRLRPGEVLAHQWLKGPDGTNTTNAIRFTFMNIELRSEDGRQWLAMDYATDVRGNCEPVFRVDANGFNAVTRKSGLLVTPKDSPVVKHQRFELQIPSGVNQQTVRELGAEFTRALLAKSFLIPEGEQRPLLRFPIGTVGDVSVAIGTRLTAELWSPELLLPNTANAESDPALGPEVEVTLPHLLSGGVQLALERKQPVSVPPEGKKWGRTALLNWLADEGVDLAAIYYDDDQYGWGIAMRTTARQLDIPWSIITPEVLNEVLKEALARNTMPLEKIDGVTDGMNLYRLYPTSVPMTFAIRTRAGRVAALQITSVTNEPPALKVRYKLASPMVLKQP